MTAQEINKKYPIKHPCWVHSHVTGKYITEDSDFKETPLVDPWNRPFPSGIKGREFRNEEFEIMGWIYETTVEGWPVECVVYND